MFMFCHDIDLWILPEESGAEKFARELGPPHLQANLFWILPNDWKSRSSDYFPHDKLVSFKDLKIAQY